MKDEYIKEISRLSDRYGSELLRLMDENGVSSLQQITEEQARAYLEALKERRCSR